MIELLQQTYTTSSSTLLRESLHFTVSKVKFRMRDDFIWQTSIYSCVNNANFSMDCQWFLVG